MLFYRFEVSSPLSGSRGLISISENSVPGAPHFTIEVEENGDSRIDSRDCFYLSSPQGNYRLHSREGLNLLNYYLNPEVLNREHLQVRILPENLPSSTLKARESSLRGTQFFISSQIREIESAPSAWFMDGHLDLALLEGIRVFSDAENAEWESRSPQGLSWRDLASVLATSGGYHLGNLEFLGEQASLVLIIYCLFNALSQSIGTPLTWHLFTGNYTSRELGPLLQNRRAHPPSRNTQENLQSNLETIQERFHRAREDLYFGFIRPVIAAACLIDSDFRNWAKQLFTQNLGSYSMLGFYKTMFGEAAGHVWGGSLRGLGMGLGVLISSFTSLYELTQIWYDTYGHLEYRSIENKIAAFISTVFSEAWLLSRAGRQLREITGSSALSWRNLAEASRKLENTTGPSLLNSKSLAEATRWFYNLRNLRNLNFQVSDLFRDFLRNFPILRWGTRHLIHPSLSAFPRAIEAARLTLQRAETRNNLAQAALQAGLARTMLQQVWYRRAGPVLLRAYLRGNAVIASRLLTSATGTLVQLESAHAATLAAGAGMKVGLLVTLGLAGGIGIGTALAYATGIYDSQHTPRNALREFIPALREWWIEIDVN